MSIQTAIEGYKDNFPEYYNYLSQYVNEKENLIVFEYLISDIMERAKHITALKGKNVVNEGVTGIDSIAMTEDEKPFINDTLKNNGVPGVFDVISYMAKNIVQPVLYDNGPVIDEHDVAVWYNQYDAVQYLDEMYIFMYPGSYIDSTMDGSPDVFPWNDDEKWYKIGSPGIVTGKIIFMIEKNVNLPWSYIEKMDKNISNALFSFLMAEWYNTIGLYDESKLHAMTYDKQLSDLRSNSFTRTKNMTRPMRTLG